MNPTAPHRAGRIALLVPIVAAVILARFELAAAPVPIPDAPFPQETALRITGLPETPPASATPVRVFETSARGEIRCFTDGRWFALRDSKAVPLPELAVSSTDQFVFADAQDQPVRVSIPWAEVNQILRAGSTTWIATARDPYIVQNGVASTVGWPSRWEVRQIAVDADGQLLVATSEGLYQRMTQGFLRISVTRSDGQAWTGDVRGVATDSRNRLWIATPTGIAMREGSRWQVFEGRDGVPFTDFATVAAGTQGEVWFGTTRGAIRYDGTRWDYRQGQRWLPDDDVRGLHVGPDGTAWFGTRKGVGAILRNPMRLAEKARHFEAEIERYIKRTPLGYTSEVNLDAPGDRSRIHYSDSDNDGLWTAMYGAGECFAYAATKNAEFQKRSRQAFEALRFLQKVTQGGPHSPPKGFVARTIRPVDWPDPNVGGLENDRRTQASSDRLWKVYEPRWPKSADGQWYWKSDTSSDELDGHYFFYARYYDLVADDAEKARVREVVRDLTDHLIAHDFCLVDHDGKPTRWGVFGPTQLNHDPRWWAERGLNSLSILSYLAVAEHVTGDSRYTAASRRLIDEHGYAANVMNPKVQSGIGSGNHSDDEMAFMCFYNLLAYTQEKAWIDRWRYAFYAYAALEFPEMNPFFNFAYAAYGANATFSNPWGDFPIAPWNGWLEDSLATLRGFPLDRCDWGHQNSHRTDIVLLPPQNAVDLYAPRTSGRGHRVGGKVIPVEERHFGHWNTDPWRLDTGGEGRELASGTVFLLPYYMGLHHGFIAP